MNKISIQITLEMFLNILRGFRLYREIYVNKLLDISLLTFCDCHFIIYQHRIKINYKRLMRSVTTN